VPGGHSKGGPFGPLSVPRFPKPGELRAGPDIGVTARKIRRIYATSKAPGVRIRSTPRRTALSSVSHSVER